MFESEFVPSVREPTPVERAYALNLLNEGFKRSLQSTVEDLPPDAQDILARDSIVMHERAVFERDDTSIIPERMLKPGVPLQLGDILSMLSVYFWWNEEQSTPQAYLETMLRELSSGRFGEAVGVLHTEFIEMCGTDNEAGGQCKNPDGYACFTRWLGDEFGRTEAKRILENPAERAENVTYWLEEIDYDEEDFDTEVPNLLLQVLARHTVDALLAAGVEQVEAQDALNVLESERIRREFPPVNGYTEFRDAGGSFEDALHSFIPQSIAADPRLFEHITHFYDGLSDDVLAWDMTRKRALVRRCIQEHRDQFYLDECTYQLEENGIAPYYRRRFAEEYWPPDQRV